MAVQIEHKPAPTPDMPQAETQRGIRLFTVDEYYKMAESGILQPDERTELIKGVIYKMSPPNPPHAGCVDTLAEMLTEMGQGATQVKSQNPLHVSGDSEPEPDIALVKARADKYRKRHPTPSDAFLVVEVSDSTLSSDRREKVPMYAEANVQVLWIVDIQGEAIEVYTNPAQGQYTKFERIGRGRTLEVPGIPNATVNVDDILG